MSDFLFFVELLIQMIICSFYFATNLKLKYSKYYSFLIMIAIMYGFNMVGFYMPTFVKVAIEVGVNYAIIYTLANEDRNERFYHLTMYYAIYVASIVLAFICLAVLETITVTSFTLIQNNIMFKTFITLILFSFIMMVNIYTRKFDVDKKKVLIALGFIAFAELMTFMGIYHYNNIRPERILIYGIFAECLLLLANYFVYKLIIGVMQGYEEQKEVDFLKRQQEFFTNYYDEAASTAKEVRMIKHDINNQLQTVYTLLANGNVEKAKEMVSDLTGSMNNITPVYYTDNQIVNTVLVLKSIKAHNSGVTTKLDIAVNDFGRLSDADLCSLFSNLYDNALEATLKGDNRFISITCKKQLNYLLIKFSNTYEVISENLETTKDDKKEHGFGLKIIKRIVEKYDGECIINPNDEGRFTITIGIEL